MSAETLRRAAALMRERAEAAERDYFSRGPWTATTFDDGRAWVGPAHISMHGYPNTAEHIASWHPVVALAVADWLDATAAENDSPDDSPLGFLNFVGTDALAALTVAQTYLGEQP